MTHFTWGQTTDRSRCEELNLRRWWGRWQRLCQSGTLARFSCRQWWGSERNCMRGSECELESFTLTCDTPDHHLIGLHFPSLQWDDHFVVSDEVGLAAVERDLHFVLYPWGTKEHIPGWQVPLLLMIVKACEWECLRRGNAVVPLVWELRETPYGGTLWLRYSSEFTANTTTPPKSTCQTTITRSQKGVFFFCPRNKNLNSPIGLGTAMTCVQSKGKLLSDQMTGWTFCMMLREMATMLQVSCRTATRLPNRSKDINMKSLQQSSHKLQSTDSKKKESLTDPGHVWFGSKRISSVGS